MTTVYKNVEHKIDWLQQIDGLSVTGAINYLISLGNADLILNCYLDGDTHGCDMVSNSLLGYYTTFSEASLYTFIKASCVFDGNGKQLTYCVLEK